MLSITRYPNQAIIIDDTIKVVVVSVTGKKVKLRIEAPREVPVFRDEIWRPGATHLIRKDNDDG